MGHCLCEWVVLPSRMNLTGVSSCKSQLLESEATPCALSLLRVASFLSASLICCDIDNDSSPR